MIANSNHSEWEDLALDNGLRKLLNGNYYDYIELVRDIVQTIKQLESELHLFPETHQ